MLRFILHRLLSLIPTLLLVSVITFGLIYALPGDPAMNMLGGLEERGTREEVDRLRRAYGLDQPVYVQYALWFGRVLQGDFGRSLRTGEPVGPMLLGRLAVSAHLGVSGLTIAAILGFSVAVVSALRPGSWMDLTGTVGALAGIALPSFWQALLMIYVFAVLLRWVPPSGYTPPVEGLWLSLKTLAMPAFVLGTHSSAVLMRQGRSALIDVLTQDYIRTARAKGLSEKWVVSRHALKNAMIPVVTILGLQLGGVADGAAIVETVFAIPGVGRTAVDAIFFRDYPVLMGSVLMVTLAVMLANLVADVVYGLLDPRIRYQ
jgi:peptide/nickel transport system permease protein